MATIRYIFTCGQEYLRQFGGIGCTISTPEINAGVSSLTSLKETIPIHSEVKEAPAAHDVERKSAIAKAPVIALRVPKEIQIIIEQTAISVVFILGDMLVLGLVRRAFH